MPKPKARAPVDPFVLDTHVWIWVMQGAKTELSPATVSLIEEAGGAAGLVISAISLWEVAMLEAKRRITLSRSIDEWVNAAMTAPGIRLVDLSPEIALESARLPGGPHGDTADRIIIATTRVLGARLITCDSRILDYGASGHIRVRDGRSNS